MQPLSELPASVSTSRSPSSANSSGISPLSRLFASSRDFSFARFANSAGIAPLSILSLSARLSNSVRSPSSTGMSPLSWLLSMDSLVRLDRLPSPGGIAPRSLFPDSDSTPSPLSISSSAGSLPLNPISSSSNPVTRIGDPPTLTPSQSPIALSAPQFSTAPPARAPRRPSSVSQSATMSAFSSASATTLPSLHTSSAHTLSPVSARSWSATDCNANGMQPTSEFPDTFNSTRLARSPNSVGRVPPIWLPLRTSLSSSAKPPSSAGISPIS